MKRLLSILALIIVSGYLLAQESIPFKKEFFEGKIGFEEAKNNFLEGNDFFAENNYFAALPFYKKAFEFNPNNDQLNLNMGIAYLHTSEKHKALEHLAKAYKLNPEVSELMPLYFARANHYILEFESAIDYYNAYKAELTDDKETKTINKYIEECNNGIALRDNRAVGLIVNIRELNSEYADFSPMISADQSTIIFTSRRQIGNGEKDPFDMQYYENIFISYFENNKWSEPQPISEDLNSKYHDANVGIDNDGQTIYVYNYTEGKGDIYKTTLDGKIWSAPILLPEPINSPYNEKCVSVSPDLKTLYFVSDRPGGKGGLDIYYTQKDANGNYGPAQNIGDIINTEYDEDGIFVHPDGTALYFSSKGHNTMGGYDIFKTEKDSLGQWTKPINLGQPINSADDDVFLFVTPNGRTGYFSSVKEGGMGEKDIYKINFSEDDPGLLNSQMMLVTGFVKDAVTKAPIKAEIIITDNAKQEVISKVNSNQESGKFTITLPSGINYGITATRQDYLFYSENFDLTDTTSYLEIDLMMEMNKVAEKSSSILRNVFFDYGKSDLKPESQMEIDRLYRLMISYPKMKIEISGHTDNVSSQKFNKELSKKRANSVANYLIKKGIKRERFTTEGYGYSKPIADNKTEEGRQKNRRVEFIITSF
ncbi:MAG: OmpA family protein [Bacteroidales bacterium]|nr:OmpA family protein [Bacteroidales bacterium]